MVNFDDSPRLSQEAPGLGRVIPTFAYTLGQQYMTEEQANVPAFNKMKHDGWNRLTASIKTKLALVHLTCVL